MANFCGPPSIINIKNRVHTLQREWRSLHTVSSARQAQGGRGGRSRPVVPEFDPHDVLVVQPLPRPAVAAEPAAVGHVDAEAVGVEGRRAGLAAQQAPSCKGGGSAWRGPRPPSRQSQTARSTGGCTPARGHEASPHGKHLHRDAHATPGGHGAPPHGAHGKRRRGARPPAWTPPASPLEHTKHQLTLTCAWCRFPFRAVKWAVQTMLWDVTTRQPAARQASPPW